MDATDRRIFRELTRDKHFFWASLDPRLSAEDVARRLKLAPTTVRARLRAWRASGVLARTEIIPHPALLGLKLGSGSIRVDDVAAKPRAIDSLALVPGALACLDHVGAWLAFNVLAESDAGLERVRRLAAKLPGVDEVTPCTPLVPPPPGPPLTRQEWDVLRALRAAPEATLREVASAVGVSEKTARARYEALVERNAALFVPVLGIDRIEGTLARVIVAPERGADRSRILQRLRAMPLLMDAFDGRRLIPSEDAIFEAWTHLPNPAAAEDAARDLLAAPGVAAVDVVFPVRQAFFSGWLDDAIEARREEAASARAPPRAARGMRAAR